MIGVSTLLKKHTSLLNIERETLQAELVDATVNSEIRT